MKSKAPFVLLDDAREIGAASARLYTGARALFIARRSQEVGPTLAAARAAQARQGGTLVGYLAYEAGLAMEPRLAPRAPARAGAAGPLVWLGLFDRGEIIAPEAVEGWLASHASGEASIGPMEPQLSTGGYLAGFEAMQRAIRAGEIYQVNLTYPLAGAWRGDPIALYASLRKAARAPYGALIHDGSHWLLSFSPELFFSLRAGEARARPMKGTRPRSPDPAIDRALARELASSTKDRAENLMITDLLRNDLARVAVPGSVAVDAPFAIESYPTVHQMVSTVRARLKQGCDAFDLLRVLFPCGSVTGAPKIRAMELIDSIEPQARGPYCGAIGRIEENGDAAFNVAIRTLRLTPEEGGGGRAVMGVGSAIVADSDAMAERRECEVKAAFLRRSSPDCRAPGFDLIETMRFDPDKGIELLELHLERIKASAAELGFAFDRHNARNRIQALCFALEHPSKLRLLISRRGSIALEAAPLEEAAGEEATREEAAGGPFSCIALPTPVDPLDWRLRHKTSDRGFYAEALANARKAGAQEAILVRPDGQVTEATRFNIFVEREGVLLTPPAALGLLPGVLRRSLIDRGRAREAELAVDDLASGFWLGNAVRGLVQARLLP